jgi:hypothetical protein
MAPIDLSQIKKYLDGVVAPLEQPVSALESASGDY